MSKLEGMNGRAKGIPLLAEEGWRDSLIEAGAPGWSVRPRRFATLTTPSAPSLRSAHPPLLCEEGNARELPGTNSGFCIYQCRQRAAVQNDHARVHGIEAAISLPVATSGRPRDHSNIRWSRDIRPARNRFRSGAAVRVGKLAKAP